MGTCKAALQIDAKQLAWFVGDKNIRVNLISAGPYASRAARAINKDFDKLIDHAAEHSPLRRPIGPEEVANATLFLCSPLAVAVTGPDPVRRLRVQRHGDVRGTSWTSRSLAVISSRPVPGWPCRVPSEKQPWRPNPRMNVYDALGVVRVINAQGTFTSLGGSVMPPEVVAAWAEASKHFVESGRTARQGRREDRATPRGRSRAGHHRRGRGDLPRHGRGDHPRRGASSSRGCPTRPG